MAKTDVAEVKNTQVGAAGGFDYGDMAHEGFEDTTVADLSIPFLNVLQSNSPEVEEQTIPGCKAGDIINSVTKEIMKQPIMFQPIMKEEAWVGWVPRNKGGGLAERYDPTDQIVKDILAKNNNSRIPPKGGDGKRIPFLDPKGNEVVETYYVYGFLLSEDGNEIESYAVLSFSSTKIKVQKDWMTSMYTIKGRPPMFANRAKISTVRQKNESGSYYNFSIAPFSETWRESLINPGTPEGMNMLTEAKEFKEMIEQGLARADTSSEAGTRDVTPPPGGESGGKDAGYEPPF